MSVQFPKHDLDPRFIIGGAAYAEPAGDQPSATAVLPADPDDLVAALNAKAGEILAGKGIVAATTPQLMAAIGEAEQRLGYRYDDLRAGRRPAAPAAEVVVELDPDVVATLTDAHLRSLNLDHEPTQAEYLVAAETVIEPRLAAIRRRAAELLRDAGIDFPAPEQVADAFARARDEIQKAYREGGVPA
jgi:hypothetical protein